MTAPDTARIETAPVGRAAAESPLMTAARAVKDNLVPFLLLAVAAWEPPCRV